MIVRSTHTLTQHEVHWRKPSVSIVNGACVEVAEGMLDIMVRDSRDNDGPVLHVRRPSWRSFIYTIKINQLCLDADGESGTIYRYAA
jgi:hypothetical protein